MAEIKNVARMIAHTDQSLKSWWESMKQRHPSLKQTLFDSATAARLSPSIVQDARRLVTQMHECGDTETYSASTQVYHLDEIVLAYKRVLRSKRYYCFPAEMLRAGDRARQLDRHYVVAGSMVILIGADGKLLLAVHILKGKKDDATGQLTVFDDTEYVQGRSVTHRGCLKYKAVTTSGWMQAGLWPAIVDVVMQALDSQRLRGLKKLLWLDQLSLHRDNTQLLGLLAANVKCRFLLANSTHFLAPADNGPFAYIKTDYRCEFQDYVRRAMLAGRDVGGETTRVIVEKIYEAIDHVPKGVIVAAFKRTAIFPFDGRGLVGRVKENAGLLHGLKGKKLMRDCAAVTVAILKLARLPISRKCPRRRRREAVPGVVVPIEHEYPLVKYRSKPPRRLSVAATGRKRRQRGESVGRSAESSRPPPPPATTVKRPAKRVSCNVMRSTSPHVSYRWSLQARRTPVAEGGASDFDWGHHPYTHHRPHLGVTCVRCSKPRSNPDGWQLCKDCLACYLCPGCVRSGFPPHACE